MAIRLRTINGLRIALCAAESDKLAGDRYLDDADHYALAAKFSQDWWNHPKIAYPEEWAAMKTQKVRDAKTELEAWMQAKSEMLR